MFTIVKLQATNSTNTYLKEWAKKCVLKNATVVIATIQNNGRGQQGETWQSEAGKNLTFSLLYRFKKLALNEQFYLNCAISLALYDSLVPFVKDKLSIKWPNDIMSDHQKIGGILIENTVKSGLITQSVIGIGLNVNQLQFSDNLPNASSLKLVCNQDFNLEVMLQNILKALVDKFEHIESKDFIYLRASYLKRLYKKGIFSNYSDGNQIFKGKICDVNLDGSLLLELENGELKSFINKSISYL